ncbi:14791_t:CDS:2, partial [Racocetra persica]
TSNKWLNDIKTIWPISKENLSKFITHLHPKVAPQTILSYLSALKYHHTMNHVDWNAIRYDPLIKQMLKTIEDNHTFKPTQQKEHITRDQLHYVKTKLNLQEPDNRMFWAIALVAFYGLARLGELLPKSQQDTTKMKNLEPGQTFKSNLQAKPTDKQSEHEVFIYIKNVPQPRQKTWNEFPL